MTGRKNTLCDLEIASLIQMVEENGPAPLLRFLASIIAHEAKDLDWGINTRMALNKIALEVIDAKSRFN